MNTLKANTAALNLLRAHEGLRLQSYVCAGGVLTIGYGHTEGVRAGMRITKKQAEELLRHDVAQYEKALNRLVRVKLNENQFGALLCFIYNIGIHAFSRSTLLSLLNRGWYEQVPAQLLRWSRAGGQEREGLIRRRRDEAALWSTPPKEKEA